VKKVCSVKEGKGGTGSHLPPEMWWRKEKEVVGAPNSPNEARVSRKKGKEGWGPLKRKGLPKWQRRRGAATWQRCHDAEETALSFCRVTAVGTSRLSGENKDEKSFIGGDTAL